jgi:predicted O-methyltransferase YrrM
MVCMKRGAALTFGLEGRRPHLRTVTATIQDARNAASEVDGWLRDDEGELLFNLGQSCVGAGAIVEIGSWKGKSTIWLGKGSAAGRRIPVWAVDPHTGSPEHHEVLGIVRTLEEFKANIASAGLDDLVVPIVTTSLEAAERFDKPVELIFIDGAHDYESAGADFDAWFPKLVEGGVMAFHDTTAWEGVRRIVLERMCRSRSFGTVHLVGSIAYARKVRQNSVGDRIGNTLMALVIGPSIFLRHHLPRPLRLIMHRVARVVGISQ